ncbi:MAG: hypothetical protein QOJ16_1798 [Acidobacteriota bacterium]|jgi:hypothetical protein|nr:hypothetical protein [Acidobacteriota bacterium]
MKSSYQLFKLWWVSVLPLTKDAIHIYVGFLCLLGAVIVLKRRLSSWWVLLPGFLLSLVMEYFDLRDGFGWAASLHDVVNTNLMPLVLVLLARWEVLRL